VKILQPLKLLIPKQGAIFIIITVVFLLISVFFYLGSQFSSLPKLESPSWEDYENCPTEFCDLIKKTGYHPEKIPLNTSLILKWNLRATTRVITDRKYLVFAPLVATYLLSSEVGFSAYNDPSRFITEVFFPHGLLEILATLFLFSLYYAIILNLILLFKQKIKWKSFIAKVFIQLIIVVVLLAISAFLESLGIYFKS